MVRDLVADCVADQIGHRSETKLPHDVRAVRLDRLYADSEACCSFLVRQALGKELDDLTLRGVTESLVDKSGTLMSRRNPSSMNSVTPDVRNGLCCRRASTAVMRLSSASDFRTYPRAPPSAPLERVPRNGAS